MEDALNTLAQEAHELYLDPLVPILDHVPTALEFYRDWVAPNKPVLIKGVFDDWPALKCWDVEYLREKIGSKEVTVTVTPNGYADAVSEGKFIMPEERSMKFAGFLDIIERKSKPAGVYYIQKQNSNFTEEFQEIAADAGLEIPWATEAFGKKPDAVNFWMGEEKAVTSMHKDHYENLYCVIHGEKQFIIIPPTDQPFVPYGEYQAAKYVVHEDGSYDVVDDMETGKVPWIPVDPETPDLEKYPKYKRAKPYVIRVEKGETLYLPSLWFHHVRQSQGCIAVNFWYDMEYDIKYNYHKFVEGLLR
ncbi:bifunctional peptidase and (3S)-lysyl hydroxylase JMJD7-like [Lineus longissimus]|uniref:bifunctional peptidase and (3S)-lysyl hydroxylase JMJD7-like n=1 Tax=Lineus longissimus TaxID=88925 RepID=UPI002B4F7339